MMLMTTDEIAKRLEPQVVEAAARAAYEKWRQQFRKREADAIEAGILDDLCPLWDDLGDEGKAEWLDQARASLAAGLAAWPRAEWEQRTHAFTSNRTSPPVEVLRTTLILPFPQESGNV